MVLRTDWQEEEDRLCRGQQEVASIKLKLAIDLGPERFLIPLYARPRASQKLSLSAALKPSSPPHPRPQRRTAEQRGADC